MPRVLLLELDCPAGLHAIFRKRSLRSREKEYFHQRLLNDDYSIGEQL